MSRISVVVPAYNCEPYIAEAVASIQGQSVRDLEIIIVDDGSTDGTLAIAQALARADSRIRVCTQPNSGRPSVARNTGIRHATGEFICFLDGDDLFLPGKLEKQLRVLERYDGVNLVFHDVLNIYENNRPDEASYLGKANFTVLARDYITPAEGNLYLCRGNYYNFMSAYLATILVSAPLLRRSCLLQQPVWFPEDMIIGEDIDLWFRLAMENRFAYLNEILSYYRRHGASITQEMGRYLKGSIEVHTLNLHRGRHVLTTGERLKYEEKLRSLHWHYGYLLFSQYQVRGARQQYLASLRYRMTQKVLTALLKSFVPMAMVRSFRNRRASAASG